MAVIFIVGCNAIFFAATISALLSLADRDDVWFSPRVTADVMGFAVIILFGLLITVGLSETSATERTEMSRQDHVTSA